MLQNGTQGLNLGNILWDGVGNRKKNGTVTWKVSNLCRSGSLEAAERYLRHEHSE
jgi:hypothetical protein